MNQSRNQPSELDDTVVDPQGVSAPPGLKVVEDPLANFIETQWKNLLIIVVAVVAVAYGRTQFIETSNARRAEASSFYTRAVESIIALGEGKATEEQKKALPDLLRALEESQAPYDALAGSLLAVKKIAEGDKLSAEAQLQLPLAPFDGSEGVFGTDKNVARLGTEVARLAAARDLLSVDEKRSQAIEALVSLVNEGEFVAASALNVLSTVAPDRVQKDGLDQKLQSRKPYVAAVLS